MVRMITLFDCKVARTLRCRACRRSLSRNKITLRRKARRTDKQAVYLGKYDRLRYFLV